MKFNQLDIFRATVAHETHEEFLFYSNFTPDLEKRIRDKFAIDKDTNLREYFGMYSPVEVNLKAPDNYVKPDFREYFSDISIPNGAFINSLGVLEVPGSMYHFTGYVSPLRNAEDLSEIEKFPFPSLENYTEGHMASQVEAAHKEHKVTCCSLTHMYEDAWQIRGYTQFLMDMVTKPENCQYILDKICERNLKRAEAAVRAGVDVLISGDDVANQRALMFSPKDWRNYMKSRWAKVYEAARRIKPDIQIWYHSDGNIEEIIPELIEIGVTILNPVQPECINPVDIKKRYGKELVLDGAVGTQTLMPFGTPTEIMETIQDYKRSLGYDGAFIISPTHILEPEVSLENVVSFIEACRN
jgi:uroporphyrinogen decarboxylase